MSPPSKLMVIQRTQYQNRMEDVLQGLAPIDGYGKIPLSFRRYPEFQNHKASIEKGVAELLGPASKLSLALRRQVYYWSYAGARTYFEKNPDAIGACWGGLKGNRISFVAAAKDAGVRVIYFDLSPFKNMVIADPNGIQYQCSLPRKAATYLEWSQHQKVISLDWQDVKASITQRPPWQGRAASATVNQRPDGPFIFVAMQVPNDAQLRFFGGEYPDATKLLAALDSSSNSLPSDWTIVLKEHPSGKSFTPSEREFITKHPKLFLDNKTDTFQLVEDSSIVMTVNSSVGIESMLFDKPVVALGQSFWAFDEIAKAAPSYEDLQKIMKDPSAIQYNPEQRKAFLTYLIGIYYVHYGLKQGPMQDFLRRKMRARLDNKSSELWLNGDSEIF